MPAAGQTGVVYWSVLPPFADVTVTSGFSFRKLFSPNSANVQQILDLISEDGWRRVDAGAHEMRPPTAPTTAQIRHYGAGA